MFNRFILIVLVSVFSLAQPSFAGRRQDALGQALELIQARYKYNEDLYRFLLDQEVTFADKKAYLLEVTGHDFSELQNEAALRHFSIGVREYLQIYREMQNTIWPTRAEDEVFLRQILNFNQMVYNQFSHYVVPINEDKFEGDLELSWKIQILYTMVRQEIGSQAFIRRRNNQKKEDWQKEKDSGYAEEPYLEKVLKILANVSPRWFREFSRGWQVRFMSEGAALDFVGLSESFGRLEVESLKARGFLASLRLDGAHEESIDSAKRNITEGEFANELASVLYAGRTQTISRSYKSTYQKCGQTQQVFQLFAVNHEIRKALSNNIEVLNGLVRDAKRQNKRGNRIEVSASAPSASISSVTPPTPEVIESSEDLSKASPESSPQASSAAEEIRKTESDHSAESDDEMPPSELPASAPAVLVTSAQSAQSSGLKESSPLVRHFNSNRLEILENVFDKTFSQFRYGELVSFIQGLGGTVEQSGTSHCRIQIPDTWTGKRGLGFSWRPHGKVKGNKVWGQALVGFRNALEQAGITPDALRITAN